MSCEVAAWTVQISVSSLGLLVVMRDVGEEDGTKVLFTKRPVGWVYFVPLGAVRGTLISGMLCSLVVEEALRRRRCDEGG